MLFLFKMGTMPQFAGAKLHLIYQITKILDVFLLQISDFVGFRAFPRAYKLVFHAFLSQFISPRHFNREELLPPSTTLSLPH